MKIKNIILYLLCLSILIAVTGCGNSKSESFKPDINALSIRNEIIDLCEDNKFDMKKGAKYVQEIYITIADGNCTVSGLNPKNFGNDGWGEKSSGKDGTGNKLQDPSEGKDLETHLAINFANIFGDETLSAYAVCSNGGERIFVACAEGRKSRLVAGVDFPKIEFTDSGIEVPDFSYPKDVGISKTVALQ